MKNHMLSATTVKGTKVRNQRNEDIGKIQDLMINLEEGNIEYAVLSFGGFLGMGDKYFAVPMQALRFSTKDDDHIITMDVTKEKLENAPGFDKDDWPSGASSQFVDDMYKYYGYERPSRLVRK
ncbi:MAG: PRC-barrel domain-containing protein [Bacteroidota bacterium]